MYINLYIVLSLQIPALKHSSDMTVVTLVLCFTYCYSMFLAYLLGLKSWGINPISLLPIIGQLWVQNIIKNKNRKWFSTLKDDFTFLSWYLFQGRPSFLLREGGGVKCGILKIFWGLGDNIMYFQTLFLLCFFNRIIILKSSPPKIWIFSTIRKGQTNFQILTAWTVHLTLSCVFYFYSSFSRFYKIKYLVILT